MSNDGFTFEFSGLDASGEAPPADPSEGEWLFKDNGVVLGPVSASVIMQRIDEGGIDRNTPIGRRAGEWTPVHEIAYFHNAVRIAEARARRVAAEESQKRALRSRATKRALAVAGLAIAPLLLGAAVSRTVMVAAPWDDSEQWRDRTPALVDLAPKPKPKPKPAPPPAVKPPATDAAPEPAKVASVDTASSKRKNKRKKRRDKSARQDKKKTQVAAAEKKKPDTSPVKKPAPTLTNTQVKKGFAKGIGGYKRCISAEFSRDKELTRISVRLEFTITESGKAIGTRVKERQFRGGPLEKCLKKTVAKLRWPKFSGERRNAVFPLRAKR